MIYSEDGQLLTASFMDYFMPRATDLPALLVHHHVVPCTTNPLGVKGAGKLGVAGSLPSGASAILDALASRGITHLDLPMTSQRIWSALHEKKGPTGPRKLAICIAALRPAGIPARSPLHASSRRHQACGGSRSPDHCTH